MVCKKMFKKRGLKIHQTKSGCAKRISETQRINKSEAARIQEQHHSGASCRVNLTATEFDDVKVEDRSTKVQRVRIEGKTGECKTDSIMKDEREDEEEKTAEIDIHVQEELYLDIISGINEESKQEQTPKKPAKSHRKTGKKAQVDYKTQDIRKWAKREVINDKSRNYVGAERKVVKDSSRHTVESIVVETAKETEKERNISDTRSVVEDCKEMYQEEEVEGEKKKPSKIHDSRQVIVKREIKNDQEDETQDIRKWVERKVIIDDSRNYVGAERKVVKDSSRHTVESIVVETAKKTEKERNISDTRIVVEDCKETYQDEEGEVGKKPSEIHDSRQVTVKSEILTKNDQEGVVRDDNVSGEQDCLQEVKRDNRVRGLKLTTDDLQTLDGSNWLNDMVINQYLNLIQQRNDADTSLPSMLALNTFVHNILDEDGLEEGEKRMEGWFKIDLRTKDLIICPINKNHHWTLIVIDTNRKRINYFDSLRGSRKSSGAPKLIKRFIESYYKKKGEDVVFMIKIRQDTPVQTNGVDCGVFALKCAERIAAGCILNFSQQDAKNLRLSMRREILEGKLDAERRRVQHVIKKTEKCKVPDKKTQRTHQLRKGVEADKETSKQEYQGDSKQQDNKDGRKDRIDFPKSNSAEWGRLDNDLTHMLKIRYAPPRSTSTNTSRANIYIMQRKVWCQSQERKEVTDKRSIKETSKVSEVEIGNQQAQRDLQKCPRK